MIYDYSKVVVFVTAFSAHKMNDSLQGFFEIRNVEVSIGHSHAFCVVLVPLEYVPNIP